MFTSVCPIINQTTGEVYSVISHAIEISSTQDILYKNLPSDFSRFAIATEKGYLIAITGLINTIDYFDKQIVAKKITEISDPIWSVVMKDSRFLEGKNFSGLLTLDSGQKKRFSIIQVEINMAPNLRWKFYSVLCSDDFIGSDEDYAEKSYNYSYLIVLITTFTFSFLTYYLESLISSFQYRIISNKKEEEKKKIKPCFILNNISSINKLKSIKLIHDDNIYINENIDKIIDYIEKIGNSLFIDFEKISNTFDSHTLKKFFNSNFGDLLFEIPKNHFEFKIFKTNFIPFSFIPKDNKSQIEILFSIFERQNDRCKLFDSFNIDFFEQLLKNYPKNELDLLIHSFLFLEYNLTNFYFFKFYNFDMIFSIYIVLLSWNLSIQRTNESFFFQNFFLNNYELFDQNISNILKLIYSSFIDKNLNIQRWINFTYMCKLISQTYSLNTIIILFTEISFNQNIFKNKIFLSCQESIILSKLLMISSTFSYFFFNNSEINIFFTKNTIYDSIKNEIINNLEKYLKIFTI